MAKLKKLNGKKIALLGLGLENQALLSLLDKKNIKAEVTICDKRSKKSLKLPLIENLKVNYQLGTSFNKNLYKFDILFRSPGWPIFCVGIEEAKKRGRTRITSPLNLFFILCPSKNIIGVTGTKGKGTTASLIYQIIKKVGKKVFLGGNIGIAPISFLEKIKITDYIVLELSSFQLEDLAYSPKISIITNLFKEHLMPADPYNPNFHFSFAKYWQAKLNIANKQRRADHLVANASLKKLIEKEDLDGQITYFTKSRLKSQLIGNFNKENIAAAVAVAKILKIKTNIYTGVINNFSNLEHRLRLVTEIDGVRYFDNSFSTTPESTLLDLDSFSEPIVQIAGGADKGANFKGLAKKIKNRVKFLILLPGGSTPRLKNELMKINFDKKKIKEVKTMSAAVQTAKSKAGSGDIVLLSTACASFGLFRNYKERGNMFKEYVKKTI